jgi:hypothetical protein
MDLRAARRGAELGAEHVLSGRHLTNRDPNSPSFPFLPAWLELGPSRSSLLWSGPSWLVVAKMTKTLSSSSTCMAWPDVRPFTP